MAFDPDQVMMGACQVWFGSVDMGYTKGGVKVAYTVDTYEKTVDQEDSAIDEIIVKQNLEITVPFAEYNLRKFIKWLPGASLAEETNPVDPDNPKLKLILSGFYGTSLRNLAQRLVLKPLGASPNDWVTVYKAMPKPNLEFAYELQNVRVYNVVFRALRSNNALVVFGDTTLTGDNVTIVEGDSKIPIAWFNEPV